MNENKTNISDENIDVSNICRKFMYSNKLITQVTSCPDTYNNRNTFLECFIITMNVIESMNMEYPCMNIE